MSTYDLFVSYRRLDAQRVRPLVRCLRGLRLMNNLTDTLAPITALRLNSP